MENKDYFSLRKNLTPKIYAYTDSNPELEGLIKIGYTAGDILKRVKQQYPTVRPGKNPFKIVLEQAAIRKDGTTFIDKDVHKLLLRKGIFYFS